MYLFTLLLQTGLIQVSTKAPMGPASIGVEVQRNTDGDIPSTCEPSAQVS